MSDNEYCITPRKMRSNLIRQGWATEDTAPSSWAILHKVVEGWLDAKQISGRYRFRPEQLPEIGTFFGLKDPTANK
jgi:hypothetical protein